MICQHCQEELLPQHRNPSTPLLLMHWQCGFRVILGSVAHMKGLCGCYVAGSELGDPPGLSLREAAKVAAEYWESLTELQKFAAIHRPHLVRPSQPC